MKNASHIKAVDTTRKQRTSNIHLSLGLEKLQGRLLLCTLESGRTMGLEPTNGGTTILCLNHLATLAIALPIIASC
jgi:hypothetical protein